MSQGLIGSICWRISEGFHGCCLELRSCGTLGALYVFIMSFTIRPQTSVSNRENTEGHREVVTHQAVVAEDLSLDSWTQSDMPNMAIDARD